MFVMFYLIVTYMKIYSANVFELFYKAPFYYLFLIVLSIGAKIIEFYLQFDNDIQFCV